MWPDDELARFVMNESVGVGAVNGRRMDRHLVVFIDDAKAGAGARVAPVGNVVEDVRRPFQGMEAADATLGAGRAEIGDLGIFGNNTGDGTGEGSGSWREHRMEAQSRQGHENVHSNRMAKRIGLKEVAAAARGQPHDRFARRARRADGQSRDGREGQSLHPQARLPTRPGLVRAGGLFARVAIPGRPEACWLSSRRRNCLTIFFCWRARAPRQLGSAIRSRSFPLPATPAGQRQLSRQLFHRGIRGLMLSPSDRPSSSGRLGMEKSRAGGHGGFTA